MGGSKEKKGYYPGWDGTVVKFPNLGVVGGCKKNEKTVHVTTASCQSGHNSGGKRRYCKLGDKETGGQPNKAQKLNLLPGIIKH